MRVLVVDDEPLVRLSLRRALEKRGHQVFEAVDGQDGVDQWQQKQPDVVFLDVLMPKLSGLQVLQKLKAEGQLSAKVLLMSAFTGEDNAERAKSAGADLFLQKPFSDIFAVIDLAEKIRQTNT